MLTSLHLLDAREQSFTTLEIPLVWHRIGVTPFSLTASVVFVIYLDV